MAGWDVTSVYRNIIDEVITKSRHEFVQEGVDEAVLDELRVLWEEKLQQTGVLAPEAPRAPALPYRPLVGGFPGSQVVHTSYSQPLNQHFPGYYSMQAQRPQQLGNPAAYTPFGGVGLGAPAGYMPAAYASTYARSQTLPQHISYNAYQRPAAQPQQVASPVPRPQTLPQGHQNIQKPTTPGNQPHQSLHQFIQSVQQQQAAGGAPTSQYPARPAAIQQRAVGSFYQQLVSGTANGQLANSADDLGQKRKAEVQQESLRAKLPAVNLQPGGSIPQQDGSGDGDGDGSGSGTAGKAGSDEAEEAPVDNLSDVPSSDEEEEEEIANHCISQYTKVTRTKNRWKAQLLAGVLHLNGRDHVFHSAMGEFQF